MAFSSVTIKKICILISDQIAVLVCLLVPSLETVYLVVTDRGSDWAATESVAKENFPWISFLHCVAHIDLLVMNDIEKIKKVKQFVDKIIDCHNWFVNNQKAKAILEKCA